MVLVQFHQEELRREALYHYNQDGMICSRNQCRNGIRWNIELIGMVPSL